MAYPQLVETDARRRLTLDRLHQPRAHEYVAEQLRRQISLRLVRPGDPLPPERELATILRVGRSTVQRAIAILEAEGLVERRRGRTGGTFVVGITNDQGSVSDRTRSALAPTSGLILEALDFRLELEPAAAARAAALATPGDLELLRVAAADMLASADDETFMRHDTELHLAVAHAAQNRFFVESVERIRLVLNDALAALPDSKLWHERSHREHDAILAAITSRDTGRARRAMRAHVVSTDAAVRALLAAV